MAHQISRARELLRTLPGAEMSNEEQLTQIRLLEKLLQKKKYVPMAVGRRGMREGVKAMMIKGGEGCGLMSDSRQAEGSLIFVGDLFRLSRRQLAGAHGLIVASSSSSSLPTSASFSSSSSSTTAVQTSNANGSANNPMSANSVASS